MRAKKEKIYPDSGVELNPFDFIGRDWKQILARYHFNNFEEIFFVKNYVRLLKAGKPI